MSELANWRKAVGETNGSVIECKVVPIFRSLQQFHILSVKIVGISFSR